MVSFADMSFRLGSENVSLNPEKIFHKNTAHTPDTHNKQWILRTGKNCTSRVNCFYMNYYHFSTRNSPFVIEFCTMRAWKHNEQYQMWNNNYYLVHTFLPSSLYFFFFTVYSTTYLWRIRNLYNLDKQENEKHAMKNITSSRLSGISRKGGGLPILYFAIFSKKSHEIEKNLDVGEGALAPKYPPMSR